jgi:hypothetical protein
MMEMGRTERKEGHRVGVSGHQEHTRNIRVILLLVTRSARAPSPPSAGASRAACQVKLTSGYKCILRLPCQIITSIVILSINYTAQQRHWLTTP